MTSFTERLEQYLAFRRRLGGDWTAAAQDLRPFVVYADTEAAEWISVDLFIGWKSEFGSAGTATWNNRLTSVRGFTAWLKDIDPRTEVPPKELIPRRYQRPTPHIYSDIEIAQILTEAAQLTSRLGLRGKTYATLFGLLAVTGLRIGEALGLDDRDVDLEAAVLFVRRGKNDKSRFIPVTDCTAERLGQYRAARSRIFGTAATAAFFVGENGQRLEIHAAQSNFAKICQKIGLREKQPGTKFGRGPRLHDMRHTMASKTILDWFRSGRSPDREMYKLSTYLGHANPGGTYWYIEAVPELLSLASERAEQCFEDGGAS